MFFLSRSGCFYWLILSPDLCYYSRSILDRCFFCVLTFETEAWYQSDKHLNVYIILQHCCLSVTFDYMKHLLFFIPLNETDFYIFKRKLFVYELNSCYFSVAFPVFIYLSCHPICHFWWHLYFLFVCQSRLLRSCYILFIKTWVNRPL